MSYDFNSKCCIEENVNIKDLRIASILDEFSFNCYKEDLNLYPLDKDNYMKQLKTIKPHILFVESAWNSYQGGFRVSVDLKKIVRMIYYCRNHNIITIFWNKEDPVHFYDFIKKASYFDYILTTDINSVEEYKKITHKENVYPLMFAAQPKIHNPIKEFDEKVNKGVFAGTFYRNKYPLRIKDLMNMLYATQKYGLDIYDRNYYKKMPKYRYPALFSENVVGALPYAEINKAYKGYKVNLNLNTVTDSETMFSRRVFEVLACNTPVISNFSKGIEKHFKDIVLMGNTYEEFLKLNDKIFNDESYYRHITHQGVREVLLNHTYENRVEEILNIINVKYAKKYNSILVICKASDKEKVKKMFNSQVYEHKTLCALEDITYEDMLNYDYFTIMESNNYYGKYYLTDLCLAIKYLENDIQVIGKGQKYHYIDGVLKLNKHEEYVYTNKLKLSSSIVKTSIIDESKFEYMKNGRLSLVSYNGFSIDSFSFCEDGNDLPKKEREIVDDESW